jgi:GT2 family glycosyltransferase
MMRTNDNHPALSVAVIVLNFNKKEELLECLSSVKRSVAESRGVIVVDNGSSDGSAQAVKSAFPEVHLVQSEVNRGAPSGRNLGLEYLRKNVNCRYVLFLDNDAGVDERCIVELTTALDNDPAAGIVCPKTYRESGSPILFSTGIRVHFSTASVFDTGSGQSDLGQFDRREYVDACGAFAFLIRREVLDRVGVFDETFNPYGWEDVDLCLRARRAGFRVLYVPTAIAYHAGGKTGRGVVPRYEKSKARNFVLLMKKHARMREWIGASLIGPFKAVKIILAQAFRGNAASLGPFLRGFWEGLNGR